MRFARLLTIAALLALVLSPVPAAAVSFTLEDSEAGVQGTTVSFEGSITTDAGDFDPLFLNAITFTFLGPPQVIFDDLPFFNLPPELSFTGAGGRPTGTGVQVFFELFLGAAAPGTYSGSATILGGATIDDQTELGTQDFSLTIRPGQVGVPEPSTLLGLALGLGGLVAARRLKSRR
jgi:PEP-CTERM motif-containing protein